MSEDTIAVFRLLRAQRQEQHRNWYVENTATLKAAGIPFALANGGETLVIREAGMPRIDFYPSTGRWRCIDRQKTYSGGATAFLKWYRSQPTTNTNPSPRPAGPTPS